VIDDAVAPGSAALCRTRKRHRFAIVCTMTNRASGQMVWDQNLGLGRGESTPSPDQLVWRGLRNASKTVPAEIMIVPMTTNASFDPPVTGIGASAATVVSVVCESGSSVLV